MQGDNINNESKTKINEITVGDVVKLVLRNWYWFVISVVICAGLGLIYIKSQHVVYSRTASVLIKDDSKGSVSESAAFDDVSMMGMSGNIANEQLIFKSKRLMQNVVRRLRLDISYGRMARLRMMDLYNQTPLTVRIADETEEQILRQTYSLILTPISTNEVDISADIQGEVWQSKASLNDTIDSPFGRLVITSTMSFDQSSLNVPIYVNKRRIADMAQSISNALMVSLVDSKNSSTILNLSYNDSNTRRAEDILNTLIEEYNEDANNDRNQIALNTSTFIDERLAIIESELGSVDSDIEEYKRQNRLTDISSESSLYLQSSSQYQQQSVQLMNQLDIANAIRIYLNDVSKSSELIPSNTGLSDSGVESQINDYNAMLLQRNRYDVSDRNPVVINMNNNLAALRQNIIAAVDNLVNTLEMRIRSAQEQEAQASRRISQVPTQQKYVLTVERQQTIKESLYLYLLNKREETVLTQSIKENKAKVIDAAYGSNIPVSPRAGRIYIIAIFLGFFIPSVIFWLLFFFDNRIRTRNDLEMIASMSFLGYVPFMKKDKKKNIEKILVKENGKDPFTEAFRKIKTSLFLNADESYSPQVIMITSYNKQEGKSFVALNLAASLANNGSKVLLIDMDIRNNTSKDAAKGLTDYLNDNVVVEQLIVNNKDSINFDILPVGTYNPNTIELLFGSKLDQLIRELRHQYDYILIDTVDIHQYADAFVINRIVDATVLVAKYGELSSASLAYIDQLSQQQKLKNMTVIINGKKPEPYRLILEDK